MDNVLTKYAQLRADLDRPVTVQVDVAQAFREVYDAAAALQESVPRMARASLLRLMSDLSEEHWSAGWLVDTEYSLWQACEVGGSYVWAFAPLGDDVVTRLCELRALASGWWTWPHGSNVEVFVSIDEMAQQFARWQQERGRSDGAHVGIPGVAGE